MRSKLEDLQKDTETYIKIFNSYLAEKSPKSQDFLPERVEALGILLKNLKILKKDKSFNDEVNANKTVISETISSIQSIIIQQIKEETQKHSNAENLKAILAKNSDGQLSINDFSSLIDEYKKLREEDRKQKGKHSKNRRGNCSTVIADGDTTHTEETRKIHEDIDQTNKEIGLLIGQEQTREETLNNFNDGFINKQRSKIQETLGQIAQLVEERNPYKLYLKFLLGTLSESEQAEIDNEQNSEPSTQESKLSTMRAVQSAKALIPSSMQKTSSSIPGTKSLSDVKKEFSRVLHQQQVLIAKEREYSEKLIQLGEEFRQASESITQRIAELNNPDSFKEHFDVLTKAVGEYEAECKQLDLTYQQACKQLDLTYQQACKELPSNPKNAELGRLIEEIKALKKEHDKDKEESRSNNDVNNEHFLQAHVIQSETKIIQGKIPFVKNRHAELQTLVVSVEKVLRERKEFVTPLMDAVDSAKKLFEAIRINNSTYRIPEEKLVAEKLQIDKAAGAIDLLITAYNQYPEPKHKSEQEGHISVLTKVESTLRAEVKLVPRPSLSAQLIKKAQSTLLGVPKQKQEDSWAQNNIEVATKQKQQTLIATVTTKETQCAINAINKMMRKIKNEIVSIEKSQKDDPRTPILKRINQKLTTHLKNYQSTTDPAQFIDLSLEAISDTLRDETSNYHRLSSEVAHSLLTFINTLLRPVTWVLKTYQGETYRARFFPVDTETVVAAAAEKAHKDLVVIKHELSKPKKLQPGPDTSEVGSDTPNEAGNGDSNKLV